LSRGGRNRVPYRLLPVGQDLVSAVAEREFRAKNPDGAEAIGIKGSILASVVVVITRRPKRVRF
jgi:hypothetical protein